MTCNVNKLINFLTILFPVRRCEYCNSIFVCFNWFKYQYENIWIHECWECSGCQETNHKVRNGIPYGILCYLYGVIGGYRKWYQVRKRYL